VGLDGSKVTLSIRILAVSQQNAVGLSTGDGLAIVATRTRVVEREALYWQLLAQGVARWRPAGRSESAARPAIGGGQNWAESAH
jgi:hypothetical protein